MIAEYETETIQLKYKISKYNLVYETVNFSKDSN